MHLVRSSCGRSNKRLMPLCIAKALPSRSDSVDYYRPGLGLLFMWRKKSQGHVEGGNHKIGDLTNYKRHTCRVFHLLPCYVKEVVRWISPVVPYESNEEEQLMMKKRTEWRENTFHYMTNLIPLA